MLLFIAEQYSGLWQARVMFMESPVDGHFGNFHSLTIRNNDTMSIHVQVWVWTCVFISLGQIPGSRIAGLYDKANF